MQRDEPPLVLGIDVGPLLDQPLGHLHVVVACRQVEGGGVATLLILAVDVLLGDQLLHLATQ